MVLKIMKKIELILILQDIFAYVCNIYTINDTHSKHNLELKSTYHSSPKAVGIP